MPWIKPQHGSCLDVAGQSLCTNLSFLERALLLPPAVQEQACAGRRAMLPLVHTLVITVTLRPPSCAGSWAMGMYQQARDFWAIGSNPGPERLSRHRKVALQICFESEGHHGKWHERTYWKTVAVYAGTGASPPQWHGPTEHSGMGRNCHQDPA